MRGTPHSDLLQRFNFVDLKARRDKASLFFLKKIIRNDIDCPSILGQFCFGVPKASARSPIYAMCSEYYKQQDAFDLLR